MAFRQKLGYTAFGGFLMLIGMIGSSIFMPNLIAQRDRFGEIECTRLAVVDAKGNERIILGTDSSDLLKNLSWEPQGPREISAKVRVLGDEHGGTIFVYNEDGRAVVRVGDDEHGGEVHVVDAEDGSSSVWLRIFEQGGFVQATGKNGVSRAELSIRGHGGVVETTGKNGLSRAVLRSNEHGGVVEAYPGPYLSGEGKAIIGINECGNGAVSTWDRNGNRQ